MNEAHSGSQGTYDFIGKWITPDFFFSKNDAWDRMGFLGPFGDYILSCTKGDIAEIGTGESSIYLSHLARKYERRIFHCDIAASKILNPLTVAGYMTPEAFFSHPDHLPSFSIGNSHFYCEESDIFFSRPEIKDIVLAFIDGDHKYEQVKKDFYNMADRTVENGYILLHDTYPPSEDYVDENRCGDVYKLRQEIERDHRFDCLTLPRGTAMGVGLSIVRKKPKERLFYNE